VAKQIITLVFKQQKIFLVPNYGNVPLLTFLTFYLNFCLSLSPSLSNSDILSVLIILSFGNYIINL